MRTAAGRSEVHQISNKNDFRVSFFVLLLQLLVPSSYLLLVVPFVTSSDALVPSSTARSYW